MYRYYRCPSRQRQQAVEGLDFDENAEASDCTGTIHCRCRSSQHCRNINTWAEGPKATVSELDTKSHKCDQRGFLHIACTSVIVMIDWLDCRSCSMQQVPLKVGLLQWLRMGCIRRMWLSHLWLSQQFSQTSQSKKKVLPRHSQVQRRIHVCNCSIFWMYMLRIL